VGSGQPGRFSGLLHCPGCALSWQCLPEAVQSMRLSAEKRGGERGGGERGGGRENMHITFTLALSSYTECSAPRAELPGRGSSSMAKAGLLGAELGAEAAPPCPGLAAAAAGPSGATSLRMTKMEERLTLAEAFPPSSAGSGGAGGRAASSFCSASLAPGCCSAACLSRGSAPELPRASWNSGLLLAMLRRAEAACRQMLACAA
jgi:hypothetical protein